MLKQEEEGKRAKTIHNYSQNNKITTLTCIQMVFQFLYKIPPSQFVIYSPCKTVKL